MPLAATACQVCYEGKPGPLGSVFKPHRRHTIAVAFRQRATRAANPGFSPTGQVGLRPDIVERFTLG
jgi:hypothetical protein